MEEHQANQESPSRHLEEDREIMESNQAREQEEQHETLEAETQSDASHEGKADEPREDDPASDNQTEEGNDERLDYWQQIAKEAEEIARKKQEEGVFKNATEDKDEDAKSSKSETEERDTEEQAVQEPTEEEKERSAEALTYWQKVAEESSNSHVEPVKEKTREEDAHEAVAQSEVKQQELEDENQANEENESNEHVIVSVEEVETRIRRQSSLASEKGESNEAVLQKIANEVEDEDDKSTVNKMLAWAKKSRKPKTETFVIRAKKKDESIKRAIDVSGMKMVIEDKSPKAKSGVTTVSSPTRKFEISETDVSKTFQVRKSSLIKPASETIVTKEWITNAVKICEQVDEAEIIEMKFNPSSQSNVYEALIKAKVAGSDIKEYHWIIKESPKASMNYDPKDKDTFMLSDLGSKIAKFVAQKLKTTKKTISIPFQPVIMSDQQYAIFEDISNYKMFSSPEGLDLEHVKLALKGLAKIHAMSYAFFNKGSVDDVKNFSEVLKLMIDKPFQPSSSHEDKRAASDKLENDFEAVINVVNNLGGDATEIAKAAKLKFRGRLYDICKDANDTNSKFSVLCHGFPIASNFRFLYNQEGRPTSVKLIHFQRARYANVVTDLQLLFNMSVGPKLDQQKEFLLRFVYYETLSSTLKLLGVNPEVFPYNVLETEFHNQQVYGCLMGAMFLIGSNSSSSSQKPVVISNRAPGKRVFESKLLGRFGEVANSNRSEGSVSAETRPKNVQLDNESTTPGMRAKILLNRALHQ